MIYQKAGFSYLALCSGLLPRMMCLPSSLVQKLSEQSCFFLCSLWRVTQDVKIYVVLFYLAVLLLLKVSTKQFCSVPKICLPQDWHSMHVWTLKPWQTKLFCWEQMAVSVCIFQNEQEHVPLFIDNFQRTRYLIDIALKQRVFTTTTISASSLYDNITYDYEVSSSNLASYLDHQN